MSKIRRWPRRLVKAAVAAAICRAGTRRALDVLLRRSVPVVVGYHRVVDRFDEVAPSTMPGMLVSRAMLERHLDWIGRRYRFVSLDELDRQAVREEHGRPPLAAVTFDDGYRDLYEHAFPLLMRKGIPATIFVVSSLIGTRRLHRHDELYLLLARALKTWRSPLRAFATRLATAGVWDLARARICATDADASQLTVATLRALGRDEVRRVLDVLVAELGPIERHDCGLLPLSWPMVTEMHAAGITIGSHTKTHARLATEPLDMITNETEGSKRELELALGTSVRHLAYPDGCFDRAAVAAVAASGYEFAYTTCLHRDPRHPMLTIPRCLLWEHSSVDAGGRFAPDILECQLRGFLTGPRACTWQSHV